jgi:alpha-2-macroglobulin
VPYPAVRSSEPAQGERAYPPENNGVYLDFASPMAWESFVDEIIIEPTPEPGKLFLDYYPGSTWLGIRFPLAPQTDYLVQIPASAADPYGNTLGEPFVLRFRTGDYAPFYTPSLPQFVNHFSTSFPTAVAFLQRNTQQIDVALYQADPDFANLSYYANPSQLTDPLRTWQLRPDSASNSAAPLRLELNDGEALPPGIYYLTTLSDEERRNEYDPRVYLLVVGETNLVLKQMVDGVHVWAVDLATGLPASGLRLSLWDDSGRQLLEPINTDNNGWAKFDYVPERYYGYLTVMANTPGEPGFGLSNSNWSNGADPWQMNLPFNPGVEEAYTSYVFTDRPLYRPGDTVYVKGYVRLNDYGRFALPSQTQVRVELTQTGFYGESEPFQQELMLPLNTLGGFDGEFVLPAGGQLGTYALTVTTVEGTYLGNGSITVAEFRKPELEVSVSTAVSATLRNQPSQATVQATYFFGGPAANLPVNYEVSDAPFVPSFDLPYSFGAVAPRPWYFYDQYSPDSYDGATLFSGTGTTDAQGQLIINLPADLLANSPAGSRQINLQATVMDVSNQIVAGRTSQIHHSAEVYVGVQLAGQSLFRANQEIPVNLISVNWDGQIVPNQAVTVRYYQQTWVRNPETGYSEPVDTPVGQSDVTTDSEGEASTIFVPTEAGSYWAEATITDGGGRTQQSAIWFWVSGDDPAQWQPSGENRTMPLVADKEGYIVGETAQILVQSPFTSPVQAWVTVERGGLLRQTLVTLNSNSEIINIPLTAEDAPNVFVSVTAVKGVTDDPTAPFADMRLGVIELPVDPDPFLLRLSLVPQATQWEPGETATFALTLTDANGQPIVGDVTLALVDKALLSLAPPNSPNIVEAFYGRQPYRTVIGASLLMSAEGVDLALLEQLEKGGGGNMAVTEVAAEADMMMEAMPPMAVGAPLATPAAAREAGMGGAENTAVRSDFQDTAYWQATLTTDSNGQATIEIPLPDNLTTWQLHAKAMTADTLVGQADSEITVQKPLLLRPITPRFFVLGDVLELGTAINNNSDTAQETLVTLQAVGVTVQSPLSQTVTVLPGQSAVVRWTVAVNQLEAREVDLTFTAVSDQYSDATKPTFGFGDEQLLPIYRYNAQDIVGTSGVLPPDQPRRVEALLLPQGLDPELGNFTVYFNGSLAAVVLDSVQALNVDPEYVANRECAHQMAYQLLPNSVTARALRLLNEPNTAVLNELDQIIPRDIDLITGLQKEDGGWGWCASLESDPGFTAYILLALDKAQEAGYSVPPATMSQAAAYLRQQISNPARLENSPYQATYEAYFLYVLAEVGENVTAVADELFNENRTLLDTAGLAFLLHAYTLNGGSPNQATLLADLNGRAVVSATGAHWESALGWGGLWSDVQTTAVVLNALIATEPDTTFGPQAVRWLIKTRQGQLWRTLYDSSWVLLALTDWMVSTGELEADFAYSLWVNGEDTAVQTGSFSRDSITRTDKLQLPLSQLNPDDTNFFDFQRNGTSGNLYYNAYLDSFIAADLVPPLSRGMTVQRTYYLASCTPTPKPPANR